MTDRADQLGAGMAAILLHQMVFTILIKQGVVAPEQVREILDTCTLQLEKMSGNPGMRDIALGARCQVKALADALDTRPESVQCEYLG